MTEYDRDEMIGYLFDPGVSVILSELEEQARDVAYLSSKLDITPGEIERRLSYLLEHGIVVRHGGRPCSSYSVDGKRLGEIMEDDENYKSAVDGLTKLDGFLN